MTSPSDLAAQIRGVLDPLLAQVAALPVPAPPAPFVDPSLIDWDRPPLGSITAVNGMELENVRVHGRILGGTAKDVRLTNVFIDGGPKPPTDVPRPIIDAQNAACEGWVLDGVEVWPAVPSVMWSEGVRVGRMATISRLWVHGTVDGLAVVTPTGRRTLLDLEDYLCDALFWSAIDPGHSDGSHCDSIQFHGPAEGVKIRRFTLRGGTKGTAGIMANCPVVGDWHLSEGDVSGGKSGVNFGPTYKVTGSLAVVDTRFECPVDVYCRDELFKVLRLDRSTRADGTLARRSRS